MNTGILASSAGGKISLTKPIVLVGLMGAGKTSVGLRLANALDVDLIDSDTEIEKAAAMSIPEIFEKHGESYFRSGERRVITRLLDCDPRVISVGGGAFMDPETRALISQHAIAVWLKADLNVLVHRTAGRTHRPLLMKGNPRQILAKLIEERYPIYSEAAVVVESLAGQTHEDMAERIIAALCDHGQAFEVSN